MSGSSKAGPSESHYSSRYKKFINVPFPFTTVPESQLVVRPLVLEQKDRPPPGARPDPNKGQAFGVSGLRDCFGVYAQIHPNYCCIIHMHNDLVSMSHGGQPVTREKYGAFKDLENAAQTIADSLKKIVGEGRFFCWLSSSIYSFANYES